MVQVLDDYHLKSQQTIIEVMFKWENWGITIAI